MLIRCCEDFGAALRKRRKALGYTQRFLSDYTGFSISFLSDLERGKPTAELGKALQLAQLLGMDLEARMRGEA